MKSITYYVVDMNLPALEQINLRHAFVPECSAMSQNVSICCRKHFRLSVMFDNFINILRNMDISYFIFLGNYYFLHRTRKVITDKYQKSMKEMKLTFSFGS